MPTEPETPHDRGRAEALFRRYLETHEPSALAGVFDDTAPELFRVALHLLGTADKAEDAVQSVFLIAMERAATFDRERRLLPWLLGILGNVASKARAREARPLDPERLRPVVAEDPVAAAEDRELRAAVREALPRLTTQHQQVLILHLQHGLDAPAIAEALGRAPGTVRMQISRAMDALRQALPVGLASAAAIMSTAQSGAAAASRAALERVRNHVLAHCPPPGSASAPAAVGEAQQASPSGEERDPQRPGTTGRPVLAALAVLVLIAVVLFAVGGPGGDTPGAAGSGDPNAIAEARDGTAANTTPPGEPLHRSPVPAERASVATGAARVVVSGPDGAPRAGVRVAHEWRPRAQSVSDTQGVALLEALPPGTGRLVVDREPMLRSVEVVAGETAEVEVTVDGTRLDISVVDPHGAPIPGAAVVAFSMFDDIERPLGRTDERGELRVEDVALGFRLGAHAPGWHSPRGVAPKGMLRKPIAVRIELSPGAALIRGQLLDAERRPVAGGLVVVAVPHDSAPPGRRVPVILRADADGRFATDSAPPGPVRVLACDPEDRERGVCAERLELAADVTSVWELRLGPGATVRGRVVDRADAAWEGLLVDLEHEGRNVGVVDRRLRHGRATTDDRGAFLASHLAPGKYTAAVERGMSRSERSFELAHGDVVEWHAVLPRGETLRVRLVGAEGRPCASWNVFVFDSLRRFFARARTDDGGRASFAGVAARPVLVMAQPSPHLGEMHVLPVVRSEPLTPGAAEHEITVPAVGKPRARLRFRVFDAAGERSFGARVTLMKPRWPYGHRLELHPAIAEHSSLAMPGGEYTVVFQETPGHPLKRVGPHTITGGADWNLGDVELPAVGVVRLKMSPAGLAGESHVTVESPHGVGDPLRSVPAGHDSHAHPGANTLWIGGDGIAPVRLDVDVQAGQAYERVLELRSCRNAVVTVQLPDGLPRFIVADLTVSRATSGTVVLKRTLRTMLSGAEREFAFTHGLEPGDYVFSVEVRDDLYGKVLGGATSADMPTGTGLAITVPVRD